MRYYIGVDWGHTEHAVVVLDDAGAEVLRRRVPHTAEGLADFGRWLDEQRAAGGELWAALERPDGRLVDFLLDHGGVVYPVNPKALDRARDRFRPSASKSDPFDAEVLAAFLRTDHAHLRALRPSSEPAQELKLLTRDADRLVRQQTRLVNQLTVTLKEYYPKPLELFDDLTTQRARAFLAAYPTPDALRALTPKQWQRFARAHRWTAAEAAARWPLLQQPQLPVPAHVVRAKARLLRVLLAQLDATLAGVAAYRKAVEAFFAAWPAAEVPRTLPAARGTVVPTLWAALGDAPGRWVSWQHLQAHGGAVPVTRRSGKQLLVGFRFACDKRLRAALHQYALVSLQHSEWARAYYDRQRAGGHRHNHALRALGAKWLKILFVMWRDHVPYDENCHLAAMARHQLRQAP
ncbi:MAG TPA: IS110 family transposase [Candidatus Sulfotelmatobacter sp.]|nr:IS110 family transposase [Candidatus Sulfotelmatobacter sp.]